MASPVQGEARRPLSELRLHEQSALVPEMAPEEYEALLADVRERGIVVPLEVTPASVVLDGRQRLRAAGELGLAQVPVRLVEPEDEIEHMLLAALNRRHLSPSRRGALAVELDVYRQAREAARERQRANLRRLPERATLPAPGERPRELAARLAGVSARTVEDAATVREADPELFERVKAGKLPVHRAAAMVRQARRKAEIGAAPPLPSARSP